MLNEFSIVVDDKNNENAIRIKEHLLYNYKITLDIKTSDDEDVRDAIY